MFEAIVIILCCLMIPVIYIVIKWKEFLDMTMLIGVSELITFCEQIQQGMHVDNYLLLTIEQIGLYQFNLLFIVRFSNKSYAEAIINVNNCVAINRQLIEIPIKKAKYVLGKYHPHLISDFFKNS